MSSTIIPTFFRPIYKPSMSFYESRLKTFEGWPRGKSQKPTELSACGFYYYGTSDRVICFYCGIGLEDWKIDDNIWLEHALYSCKCPYLLLNKTMMNSSDIGSQARAADLLVRTKLLKNKSISCLFITFIFVFIGATAYCCIRI